MSALGEVAAPRTISNRRMTFAGLKKCVPSTSRGREVARAISSTSRVDVLVARTALAFATRSRSANTRFLSSISSNTASITKSAAPTARHRRAVVGGDTVEALLQQVAPSLDNRDRDPGIGKTHRDAAAHRAGADNCAARDRARLRSLWYSGYSSRLALGEEDVALGL